MVWKLYLKADAGLRRCSAQQVNAPVDWKPEFDPEERTDSHTSSHLTHVLPPPEVNKMSLKQPLKMSFILIICVRISVHVCRYLVPLSRGLGGVRHLTCMAGTDFGSSGCSVCALNHGTISLAFNRKSQSQIEFSAPGWFGSEAPGMKNLPSHFWEFFFLKNLPKMFTYKSIYENSSLN